MFGGFENRPGPDQFYKLSVKLHEICYSTVEKDLNSPVFKSFGQFKKLFGPTQLTTYYFSIK
jgi:hypothetical protein